jgi:Holliday junction resolvase RusA-like endonuclease
MTQMIRFTVFGEPVAKGRAKTRYITTKDGRQFTQQYTPEKTRRYEESVKWAFLEQCIGQRFDDDDAIEITLHIYKSIPKSMTKRNRTRVDAGELFPGKRPDGSNILKAIEDALNQLAYRDDSQIVRFEIEQHYSEIPRVEVELRAIGKVA